jgi:hypothetical protein
MKTIDLTNNFISVNILLCLNSLLNRKKNRKLLTKLTKYSKPEQIIKLNSSLRNSNTID